MNNNARYYTNQKRKTKMCDCGRGPIYTDHGSAFNAKVGGKQVCNECKLDEIYSKFRS